MVSMMRGLLLILGATILVGCAGPVPKIDSSPTALSKVNTVAVIRPPEPKTYAVMNFGHPGMAFGLIGGLIAGGDMSSKQDKLTAAVKQNASSQTSSALAENIATRLTKMGFQATVEDGPWEETDGKFKLDIEKISSSADTVLVVAPTIVGFVATGATSDYLPTIAASVTLLGKDRKEQLYRGFHACGWHPNADGWRYSSTPVAFANFDALMADPGKTADSLSSAASAVAVTVAEDLRRE